jgi:cation/acetate symporter
LIALLAVGAVTLGTLGLGTWGVRFARTTSDLLVASRAVTPWWNAAAISGEYLSAASFLGIAGLEMQVGASALWQSLGFTAGYLALLLFVAAPLRRYGAYTIPDFAEARLRSPGIRLLAAAIVLVIGGFYLVPQLKGAGLALNVVVGSPYWVGVAVVVVIVAVNVAIGGMRGITYVQAFQFWIKVFAIAVPCIVLLIHFGGLPERAALFGNQLPHAGEHGLTVKLQSPQKVTFPTAGHYRLGSNPQPVEVAAGSKGTLPANVNIHIPPNQAVPVADGTPVLTGHQWSRPVGGTGEGAPLLVYSLLIATFLGTMGLPHVLVRFYTSPDGKAARSTTVRVLGLLSLFYLFPAVYGALGRALTPQLYTSARTDDVVLSLPHDAIPGTLGTVLTAVTCAGAFAAFLSTSSGLLVSLAGTISHDLWPRFAARRTGSTPGPATVPVSARLPGIAARATNIRGAGRVRESREPDGSIQPTTVSTRRLHFRVAAAGAMVIPGVIALFAQQIDISILVGWAFAIAASTFCPMFLLGIWWPGLTARGAAIGMTLGMLLSTGAIFVGLALGEPTQGAAALLQQPAIVSVPVAFLTMILVSLNDPHRIEDPETEMLALHAPEGLGLRRADEEA